MGGYLIAFLTIFLEAASPRSMPHISANLMRYRSTSDSSSPRCSLSDSSQFGNPLSTSPLHWNISDSSPTSPTYHHITIYYLASSRINKRRYILSMYINHEFLFLFIFSLYIFSSTHIHECLGFV